ncbi:DUF1707 SHOCT-like domain-containing protein [Nocardioides mangrovi]|uniref:DUF1707 domain-containing protein n=1 Tax=Nocardioides mangrovi TaxID=2874580 RepID=A0ABS7UB89_9ACTN|nr:DUF1707 domain-containing protein [Nocardioides mangrovi]MBZ5738104.1 DUF1707 domain-containing protein [Nocardioides mangrovi]
MDESQLRISDSEREAAAADLGEHYTLGRITTEEHAERLDRIWSARTRGDLASVFADLPALRPAIAGPGPVRRRGGRPRPAFLVLGIVALVALSAATHVPFVLLGVAALVVFTVARRRRAACGPLRLDQWRRPAL